MRSECEIVLHFCTQNFSRSGSNVVIWQNLPLLKLPHTQPWATPFRWPKFGPDILFGTIQTECSPPPESCDLICFRVPHRGWGPQIGVCCCRGARTCGTGVLPSRTWRSSYLAAANGWCLGMFSWGTLPVRNKYDIHLRERCEIEMSSKLTIEINK